MEYGAKDINAESISLYQGFGEINVTDTTHVTDEPMGVINQRDADLVFFQRKVFYSFVVVYTFVCNRLSLKNLLSNGKLHCYVVQYEKLADGSQEKADMLKQITDIKNHRSHLDSSIDAIGTKLFGPRNSRVILTSLRGQGKPIVDDWGCLKSMVNTELFC